MDYETFVKKINEYDDSREPSVIKIIVGKNSLSFNNQNSFKIISKVDIYKAFGHCAFLVKNHKTRLNDSECCVWSLLLNISTSESKDLLNKIKNDKKEDKLIEWIYYKYGIVMVNRQNFNHCFKVFENKKISDILIVSLYSYKRILNFFKCDVKISVVQHPSPNNWGFKNGTWFDHSDLFSRQAKNRGLSFEKASINSFIICKSLKNS